jgi:hypothetical protein
VSDVVNPLEYGSLSKIWLRHNPKDTIVAIPAFYQTHAQAIDIVWYFSTAGGVQSKK